MAHAPLELTVLDDATDATIRSSLTYRDVTELIDAAFMGKSYGIKMIPGHV